MFLLAHSFKQVQREIHNAGFYIDADLTDRKIDKKVQFWFMFQVLLCGWLVIPKIVLSDDDCGLFVGARSSACAVQLHFGCG